MVTYEDNRTEQVEIVSLPCPIFEDGEKLVMQRGVGVCTVKSTPEREKACMTFLKWLWKYNAGFDPDKDNTLIIRLKSSSMEDMVIGYPGPSALRSTFIFTKK